jgi:hypothetical protein
MIEDDAPPEMRQLEMFKLSAPRAVVRSAHDLQQPHHHHNHHRHHSAAAGRLPSPHVGAVRGGSGDKTWWTVDARPPELSGDLEQCVERAMAILTRIVGLRLLAVSEPGGGALAWRGWWVRAAGALDAHALPQRT